MRMFVQNVVIADGDDEEAALPLPADQFSANMGDDDEEAALPVPALNFAANRRKRGPTNLPVTECDECGFRFTPMNSDQTETKCPRCGTVMDA